jgi:hypothetical protein
MERTQGFCLSDGTGGILLLTVPGNFVHRIVTREGNLSLTELATLQEKEFLFKSVATGKLLDGLPNFYQTAFHTKAYVNEFWGRLLSIRNYFRERSERAPRLGALVE